MWQTRTRNGAVAKKIPLTAQAPGQADTMVSGPTSNQKNTEDSRQAQVAQLESCAQGLISAMETGISREVAPHDLNSIEFNLLKACMNIGECTATQLATLLPVDASRISRIVNRLVNMGLLIRQRQTHDRRIVMLRLSDTGYELAERLIARVHIYELRLIEGITSEEMDAFVTTARKILENHQGIRDSS